MEASTTRRLSTLAAVLVLALGACGGSATGVVDAGTAEEEFSFGRPADPSQADRIIEVSADDSLSFGPATFQVAAGETITFVVTNTGVIPHDFTLGDEATQEAHGMEMAEMAQGGMAGEADPNATVLPPGETMTLTWRFTEPGTVMIGCQQPGHYAGGMRATVEVVEA